ncbi:hypothetical protein DCCM_4296 [Desulfocucumis palustris]|uniref:Uncharacterized protein n=1 Tax=Desulfocucumis palustris TaxID=1898651 RepID=A0A2L2XHI5_9FIRM|nr:hypothetical protein DCCM_4296 [Desulfocucumis palustris]
MGIKKSCNILAAENGREASGRLLHGVRVLPRGKVISVPQELFL